MRILVVEDSQEKLRHVLRAISVGGAKDDEVHVAHDARQAKLYAEQVRYDLMILDLVIPSHPSEMPEQNGGAKLLRELKERERYKTPREVVGLTALTEFGSETAEMFAEDMWSIVPYDSASHLWADQLSRKVRHLLVAERAEAPLGFQCHLCVLTALPLELDAIRRLPWQWKEFERSSDVTLYIEGEIPVHGKTKRVVAAAAPRMGMTSTAILATKMIEAFRPEFIAMTGITAGVRGRCELGDVIAVEPSWDWGSGKHLLSNGEAHFSPAPHQIQLASAVRMRIEKLANQTHIFDEIKRKWPGDAPSTSLKMLIGPVASGASVLADQEIIKTIER